MTRSSSVRPVVPAVLASFLDDAAVFPPGLSPLPDAVRAWYERLDSPIAPVVGPLVLPLADLEAARTEMRRPEAGFAGRPLVVSVVTPEGKLDDAVAARADIAPEVVVAAVELKVSGTEGPWRDELARARDVASSLPIAVELSAEHVAAGALEAVASSGLSLKFRTGGLEASLFPTPEELAGVLLRAVQLGVPFKLTAGLHEAVRYTSPATGFTHHGFLNIACAVDAARRGEGRDAVVSALQTTDSAALAAWERSAGKKWREAFRSFGTCSITEPLESLARLDLFPADLLAPSAVVNGKAS
ncbi:hypothetical protein [Sinomonas flava]|uniref:hypothetical protein n=1 Tax=Sinomonas flava TaxID=496857 RepID=UPI0039A69DE5